MGQTDNAACFGGEMPDQRYSGVDALIYDQGMSDWPGEIDFYLKLADRAQRKGQAVLDLACGTGRVTLPLAKTGVRVVGLDLAADMLAIARQKAQGLPNLRWVQGNIRSFELGEKFGLVIIPVHSFQFMLTPQDQMDCLECIRRHMLPGGLLVLHVNHDMLSWLDECRAEKDPPFEFGAIRTHPQTGAQIRTQSRWLYRHSTQTATLYKVWEELGEEEVVLQRQELEPMSMHVVFRFEMEHLLARAGLRVFNLYGDFEEHPFADDSPDMIWLAHEPE
jgi:SAM-dependent methyltransferase